MAIRKLSAMSSRGPSRQRGGRDRWRAHAPGRRSEWQALVQRTRFPVSVHRRDGRLLWANAAFGALCGRPPEDLMGQALPQLLSPEAGGAGDWQGLLAMCGGREEGHRPVSVQGARGEVHHLVAEVLHPDGVCMGGAHSVIHWFDQSAQVTAERHLKEALRDLASQRQRLSHILAGTQVGAWEVNFVTGEARIDDTWAALFGYERRELEPWNRAKGRAMMHPDDMQATDLQVRRYLAGELPGVDIEQRVRMRSGEWRWVHSRGKVATWTEDGRPEWMSGSHMDIHLRKQQQAELEAQRAYTRTLLASMPGVAFEFESDEDGQFRCVYLSDALRSMFGIEPESALRDQGLLFQHVPADHMEGLRKAIAQSARQMTPLEYEYRIRAADRQRWMGVYARPALHPDGRRSWFGMLLDVTRRRELAEQLGQARQAAEAANRAKSAFLATMSHEIRSPMNGVVGMTDVLLGATTPEDQADAVQTIRESAQALLRLIDDILDFSKVEAGRLDLERIELDPAQLFESVVEAQASCDAAEDVPLSLHIAPRLPERYWGDPTRLRQILTNLSSNAIKFCHRPDGSAGAVRLTLAPAPAPREGLLFCIEDEGIGMEPALVARLFRPFVQADASTTRRYGGTGLGLAIVHRLVEIMGGEIRVHSQLGRGTRFEVWLPLAVVSPQPVAVNLMLANVHGLLPANEGGPDDLAATLEEAGAQVSEVPALPVAAWPPGSLPEGPVVVVIASEQAVPELLARLAPLRSPGRELRFLVLRPMGRPQPMRWVAPDVGVCRVLRRRALWRAVAALAGKASAEPAPTVGAPAESVTWAAARPPLPGGGGRVLVVDDDATNRKVASRQLALLGLQSDLACDGEEAFALWLRDGHALVLTDLHMPELDGYGLARRIRATEAERAWRRTPVLALTANALRGEDHLARAAGIDAYLVKPTALDALKAALQRWWLTRPGRPGGEGRADDSAAKATPGTLDLVSLRALVGDAPGVLAELLSTYRRSLDKGWTEIGQAMALRDGNRLSAVAHRLKSASTAVGAVAIAQACDALERQHADLEACEPWVDRLAPRVEALLAELDRALAAPPGAASAGAPVGAPGGDPGWAQ